MSKGENSQQEDCKSTRILYVDERDSVDDIVLMTTSTTTLIITADGDDDEADNKVMEI